jgi:hypothetical protein
MSSGDVPSDPDAVSVLQVRRLGERWQFTIFYLDGDYESGDLDEVNPDADPSEAQQALIRRTAQLTADSTMAPWEQVKPNQWIAEIGARNT